MSAENVIQSIESMQEKLVEFGLGILYVPEVYGYQGIFLLSSDPARLRKLNDFPIAFHEALVYGGGKHVYMQINAGFDKFSFGQQRRAVSLIMEGIVHRFETKCSDRVAGRDFHTVFGEFLWKE